MLAERTSDEAWKTKPAVARKEFEEKGESEEMERLLEENMVGRRNAPSTAKAPECFFVCCRVFVQFCVNADIHLKPIPPLPAPFPPFLCLGPGGFTVAQLIRI